MGRYFRFFIAVFAFGWASAASAAVELSFHSFNGSVLFGRYPHTFVVLEGTLDSTGARVNENYGFSAKSATPAVLRGPVEHVVMTEKAKWIGRTNRHFTITLSDAEYHKVKALVEKWRNAPGRYYDLEKRNCIHFVGEIGRLVGLRIEYPENMLRRPKKWLNHISALNPQLGAKPID